MPPRIAPTRGSGPSRGGGTARGGGAGRGGAVAIPAHVKTIGIRRPGFGTGGRPVNTIVNAFATTIPDGIIYHYDAINPDRLPSRLNMELFDRLQMTVAPQIFTTHAVYDGRKNAFCMQKLPLGPSDSATFNVSMERSGAAANSDRPPKVYTFKITKVAEINTEVLHRYIAGQQSTDNDVLTSITALNIVIRIDPNQKYPFNVRSFFTPEGKKAIGGGLELWRGYFQSVRPSQDRMYINLDIATGVMYKDGPLTALCLEFLNQRNDIKLLAARSIPDRERIRLQRFISGMRITTAYTGSTKTFVVKKVTAEAANKIMFTMRDPPRSISVADYFKNQLRVPLKYPDVICVEVGNSGAKIPLELCSVPPGQIMRKQIPPEKTTSMIDFSKLHPRERLASIRKGLDVLQYGQSEYIRQFGMNVTQTPLTVPARVLNPPKLQYAKSSREPTISPANGSWNMRDKYFYKSCPPIQAWAVVIYESTNRFNMEVSSNMVKGFINGAKSVGITIADPNPPVVYENGQGNIHEQLFAVGKKLYEVKKIPPQLIVVVLPEGGNQIYTAVKHFGDVTQGVATQCLKSQKCARAQMQYWANVMLKVNVKLEGTNNILHDSSLNDGNHPCIVMGADVMHPAPGAEGRPSFASLVSSVDTEMARYIAINSVQVGRQEIISDLESMVSTAINSWIGYATYAKIKRGPPSRLIFYRDGVSEGQFAQVLEHELPMIKNACIAHKIRPKITLIIVGKRHHIRMFPQNERDGDKSGNCQAGTTIDQGLGHPTEFDYYQLTHGGLLGTSRPAHYSVLYDDNGFNADAMQNISFSLCHVYARATRSVSIPAPVYYADIACARAKNHYSPSFNLDETGTVSSTNADAQLESFRAGYQPLHKKIANTMYFM